MGLLGMAARTAVVAGTATAVSGRVSRRQANRMQQQAEEQQGEPEEPAAAAQDSAPPPEEDTAPPAEETMVDQIQQLATMKEQGLLSDDEFTAAKAKLLGM